MDRKRVSMMASNVQSTDTGDVLRRQRDGTRTAIPCHQSIINYNMFMGGVDRGDQLRGYYKCSVKTRKWYKYLFYFLFDVSVTNAYILYKHYSTNSEYKTIKEFRMKLANDLIGDYCTRKRPGRVSSSFRLLPLLHFPLKSTSRKRGRCTLCCQTEKRTDTTWQCGECGVWLCHSGDSNTDCFFIWHKNRQQ